MVLLSNIRSSNSLISTTFPPGLVAVFVGATAGIGEITLKKFAQYSNRPRAYFIGRSQDAADRIVAECRTLNPSGEYIFIKADVSLIRVVDKVCEEIKAKEKTINLLVLSAGLAIMDRRETSEKLHLLSALTVYSRIRIINNLLPLIQSARGLRRVVNVAGGGKEGPLDATDFPALRVPLLKLRGHLCTLTTLALEGIAKTAPEVSFVHDYPGTVPTGLIKNMTGLHAVVIRTYIYLFGRWVCVPVEESGERHLYLTTSAKFPPASDDDGAVKLGDGDSVAVTTTGEVGSGIYSVGWDCESAPVATRELLAGLRKEGMVERILKHMEGEFERITQRH